MSKKKKRAGSQRKNEITKGIFTVLEKEPSKAFNYKQIASKLGITDTQDRNLLIKRLGQLKASDRIVEPERGKYQKKPSLHTYFTGRVDLTTSGNAYIVVEELEDDIFVQNNNLNGAFHGDTVEVFIKPRRKSKKMEGEVSKVLERKKTTYVGIVDKQKSF